MGSVPAGGGLDDGLQNLQQFIGILVVTLEQVQGQATVLQEHAASLDALDQQAEAALGELDRALDQMEEDIAAGEREAVQEMGALAEEASGAADEELSEADTDLDGAESGFTSVMGEARGTLDEALASLTTDGFQALETKTEALESALAEDRQEVEAALDSLESRLDDLLQQAVTAFTLAEEGFEQTVAEAGEKQAELQAEGGDSVTAFDGLGDDMDNECRALATDLEGLYNAWKTALGTSSTELTKSLDTLVWDTGAAVDTAEEQMSDAAQTVLDDTFEPLLDEFSEIQVGIEMAEQQSARELVALVDELETALSVVDQIDELLDAVE